MSKSHDAEIAKLQEAVNNLKDDFRSFDKKHEDYRQSVHGRLNEVHGMINKTQRDIQDDINRCARRVDAIEQNVHNIDKIVDKVADKLETFGKEVTEAITKLERTVQRNTTEKNTWQDMGAFVGKLAAFAVTVIAILKYAGI